MRGINVPQREGYGNTSGSGLVAKDAEGTVNPYAVTVTFDKTLKGAVTPREGRSGLAPRLEALVHILSEGNT